MSFQLQARFGFIVSAVCLAVLLLLGPIGPALAQPDLFVKGGDGGVGNGGNLGGYNNDSAGGGWGGYVGGDDPATVSAIKPGDNTGIAGGDGGAGVVDTSSFGGLGLTGAAGGGGGGGEKGSGANSPGSGGAGAGSGLAGQDGLAHDAAVNAHHGGGGGQAEASVPGGAGGGINSPATDSGGGGGGGAVARTTGEVTFKDMKITGGNTGATNLDPFSQPLGTGGGGGAAWFFGETVNLTGNLEVTAGQGTTGQAGLKVDTLNFNSGGTQTMILDRSQASASALTADIGTLAVTGSNLVLRVNDTVAGDGRQGTVYFRNILLDGSTAAGVSQFNLTGGFQNRFDYDRLVVKGVGNTLSDALSGDKFPTAGKAWDFYLPGDIADGETMLSAPVLSSALDLSQTTVNLFTNQPLTSLTAGQEVILYNNAVTDSQPLNKGEQVSQGSIRYTFDVGTEDKNLKARLLGKEDATFGGWTGGLSASMELIKRGGLDAADMGYYIYSSPSFPSSTITWSEARIKGKDLDDEIVMYDYKTVLQRAGQSMLAQEQEKKEEEEKKKEMLQQPSYGDADSGLRPIAFARMGGGSYKNKGTAGHSDGASFHVLAGPGFQMDNSPGLFTLGLFFEGGRGDYDTVSTSGPGSVSGDGDRSYVGGGLFLRQDLHSGLYGELGLRGGRLENEYKINNLADITGLTDISHNYFGGHVGAGYAFSPWDNGRWDIAAKLLWTRQNSASANGFSGERLKFDSADSLRSLLKIRYDHQTTERAALYGSLGWLQEYDSRITGRINEVAMTPTDSKGATALAELGVKVGAGPGVFLDFSLNGSVGQQKGWGGAASLNFTWD